MNRPLLAHLLNRCAGMSALLLAAISCAVAPSTSADGSTPAPVATIASPADGSSTHDTSLAVVVNFSAKLNPQGQPSGNVKRIELVVNGVVAQSFTNPPNIKAGSRTFTLDLTAYPFGPITLQACAYQGNPAAEIKGCSAVVTVLSLGAADSTPPSIFGFEPPPNAALREGAGTIRAHLADSGSGIDVAATRLSLDGVELVAGVVRSATEVSFAAMGISEGPHHVKVEASDLAGNPASAEWDFGVDLTDPDGGFTTPAQSAFVPTNRPTVGLVYSDPPGAGGFASGIDPDSGVTLSVDDADVTSEMVKGSASATWQAPVDRVLSEGLHQARAMLNDKAGRAVERTRSFTVDTVFPLVLIESPADGSTITDFAPEFVIFATDANGPLLTSVKVNDREIAERFVREGDRFVYRPRTGDPVLIVAGENRMEVVAGDLAGNASPGASAFAYEGPQPPETVSPKIFLLKGVLALPPDVALGGAIGRCVEVNDARFIGGGAATLFVAAFDTRMGGTPVPGLVLVWDGPGSAIEAPETGLSPYTNDAGVAGIHYRLGPDEGAQVLRVSVAGDPDIEPVEFALTAYKPVLEVTTSAVAGDPVLKGAGEWRIIARAFWGPLKGSIFHTPIDLRFFKRDEVRMEDVPVPLPAEERLFVGPEQNRMANLGGPNEVHTAVVFQEAGHWLADVELSEFSSVPIQRVEIEVAEDVVRPIYDGDPTTGAIEPDPSKPIASVVRSQVAVPGPGDPPAPPSNGRTGHRGHRVMFVVKPNASRDDKPANDAAHPPLAVARAEIFLRYTETSISKWRVTVKGPNGRGGTLATSADGPEAAEIVLDDMALGGFATFWVDPLPLLNRQGDPTQLEIEIEGKGVFVDPSTGLETMRTLLLHKETAVVFEPEVRAVADALEGGVVPIPFVTPTDPDDLDTRSLFYMEVLGTVDGASPAGSVRGLDPCEGEVGFIFGAQAPPLAEGLVFGVVESTPRYVRHRTATKIGVVHKKLPPGTLPSGTPETRFTAVQTTSGGGVRLGAGFSEPVMFDLRMARIQVKAKNSADGVELPDEKRKGRFLEKPAVDSDLLVHFEVVPKGGQTAKVDEIVWTIQDEATRDSVERSAGIAGLDHLFSLPETSGNRRKSFFITALVKYKSNEKTGQTALLVEPLRIALAGNAGTPLPTKDQSGLAGFGWGPTSPAAFDAPEVPPETEFLKEYAQGRGNLPMMTPTLKLVFVDRIPRSPGAGGSTAVLPLDTGIRVYGAWITSRAWFFDHQELSASVDHEADHVRRWVAARADPDHFLNRLLRALDAAFGRPRNTAKTAAAIYANFDDLEELDPWSNTIARREAGAEDKEVSNRFLFHNLEQMVNYFNQAVRERNTYKKTVKALGDDPRAVPHKEILQIMESELTRIQAKVTQSSVGFPELGYTEEFKSFRLEWPLEESPK